MEDIEKKLDEAGSLDEIDSLLAEAEKPAEEPKETITEPQEVEQPVVEEEKTEDEPEQPLSTVDSTTNAAEKEQPKTPEVVPYKRLQRVVEQKNAAKNELEQIREQLNAAVQELESIKKGVQPQNTTEENPLKGDYYVPADKFDEVLDRKLAERQNKQLQESQQQYVNTVKQATDAGGQLYGAEYNSIVTQEAVEYLKQVEPAKYAELEQLTMFGKSILLAKKMYEYCDSLYEKPVAASVGRTTQIKPASKTEQVKKLTDADIEQMINNATSVEEANDIYEKYIK